MLAKMMFSTVISPLPIFLLIFIVTNVVSYSHTPVQYHIQTDKGPNRYFRYQTYDGQFRKEKRFEDGTVIGTYGWVDPTGLLRLFDYIADAEGYRITRTRELDVGPVQPNINVIPDAASKYEDKIDKPHHVYGFRRKVVAPAVVVQPHTTVNKPVVIMQPQTTIDTPAIVVSPHTTVEVSATSTVSSPPAAAVNKSLEASGITTAVLGSPTETQPKLKLRPLFKRRRKRPPNDFGYRKPQNAISFDRRRENYSSVRDRTQQQTGQKQSAQVTAAPIVQSAVVSLNTRVVARPAQRIRIQTPLADNPTYLSSDSPITPDFGYDNPGGRVTINYDLGNQYRKEKAFPDGIVVGEHGYVDPMGILRITYYKSGGSEGQQEYKKSYHIGTRLPAS